MIGYIIGLILFGLIVGALARLAIPGPNPMSIGMTILIGIAGAFIGGLIGRLLWNDQNGPGWIISVLCAAVLVWLLQRRGTRATV